MRPILLDEFVKSIDDISCNQTLINENWYIAKPIQLYSLSQFVTKIKLAILVLTNQAIVIQYAEDYFKK